MILPTRPEDIPQMDAEDRTRLKRGIERQVKQEVKDLWRANPGAKLSEADLYWDAI